jgi:hypothetical protein
MSSLRLALKQSLEHAGPSVREVQSKSKRRGRPKKNEKEQHKKRKKRKLTDSEKKLLKDDEEDVINENVRTPTSSRAQTSDSSDGDSDDDGSHDSSSGSSSSSSDNQSEKSGSGSDSGDDNSADSSSDDDGNSPIAATKLKTLGKNDNNSDDDESQDAHMMEGVFEAEVSSGDDEDTDNRAINNGNQSESLSSLPNARSRKIDRDISVSHHSQASISQASSSQLKRDKKVASSTSLASASKSQESKKISSVTKTKKKNVPPPRQEVLAWVMGMSQGKQRKNIKPGLRIKVRFTKPKIRWYGGVVTKVASSNPGGHKIKIRYDDGNKEVAEFPDKEIVVDAEGNGVHQANADAFLPRDLPVLLSVPVEKKKKKIKTSKSDDESQTGESNNNNDDSIQVSQKSDQKPEKKSTPQKIQRMEETKSLKSSSEKKGSPKKNKIQPIPKSLEDMLPRVDKSPAKKKISTHGIDAEAETDEETFMHDISRKSDDGKKHSDDAKKFHTSHKNHSFEQAKRRK